MPYDPNIPEEELKTRVARDAFGAGKMPRVHAFPRAEPDFVPQPFQGVKPISEVIFT